MNQKRLWGKLLVWGSALALFVICNVAWANVASAATYYVAPTGQDSQPGTLTQPMRTIQAAVNKARAGDTVYVRGGVYYEMVSMKQSGVQGQPIRLLAYNGERPVIDGRYTLPNTKPQDCDNSVNPPRCVVGQALVKIAGNYIEFDGFKVTQSQGAAIDIGGNTLIRNIRISNCQIHEIRGAAIRGQNLTDLLVEGCDVYHAGNYAPHDLTGVKVKWPPIVKVMTSTNLTYRRNTIHENWGGAGLAAGVDSNNVVIEDNIIFNNFAVQLYVNRAQNVLIQRNLLYHTNDPKFRRGGDTSQCISLNNEVVTGAKLSTKTIRVINNIIVGCSRNIAMWTGESAALSIQDVTIQNNALINAYSNFAGKAYSFTITDKAKVSNIRVERNIFLQQNHNIGSVPSNVVTFAYNLWSRTPPTNLKGTGDIIADPQLTNPNATLQPGQVKVDWYKPLPSSPAIAANMGPLAFLQQTTLLSAGSELSQTAVMTGDGSSQLDSPSLEVPVAGQEETSPDATSEDEMSGNVFNDEFFYSDSLSDEMLSESELINNTGSEDDVSQPSQDGVTFPHQLYLPLITQESHAD